MIDIKTLRIDTPVNPISRLYALLYVGLGCFMVLLAWLAELSLLQYVLISLITATVAIYLALTRPILLHLSQPPLNQRANQGWQLLMRTHRGDALWKADLQSIQRSHWVISFGFTIVEPYQRSLSVAIFQDQISRDAWRELNVLANVMANNH